MSHRFLLSFFISRTIARLFHAHYEQANAESADLGFVSIWYKKKKKKKKKKRGRRERFYRMDAITVQMLLRRAWLTCFSPWWKTDRPTGRPFSSLLVSSSLLQTHFGTILCSSLCAVELCSSLLVVVVAWFDTFFAWWFLKKRCVSCRVVACRSALRIIVIMLIICCCVLPLKKKDELRERERHVNSPSHLPERNGTHHLCIVFFDTTRL